VFAVLHAPIAPPVKGIVGAIIGVVFVAAFFGRRYRRPPCE